MLQNVGDAVYEAGVIGRLAREVLQFALVGSEEGDLLGMSPPVHLEPTPAIRRDQCSGPKTDVVGSQLAIGELQHDAADVLVGEEVVAGELEAVQRAACVVEEGIATPAREEAIAVSLGDLRLGARRDLCVWMTVCPLSSVPAASEPSARRTVALCNRLSEDENRTRYAMSATASPSVSTLSSYIASGAKGSVGVGPSGFTVTDGCTSMMRMDLLESSGLGKANRSQKSRRASSCGQVKSGPE
jgi:hypothetical protein